jgi:hypothetical protein
MSGMDRIAQMEKERLLERISKPGVFHMSLHYPLSW